MNKLLEIIDIDLLIGLQLFKLADMLLVISALLSFLPITTIFTLILFSILGYYYYLNTKYVVSYLCLVEVLIKLIL